MKPLLAPVTTAHLHEILAELYTLRRFHASAGLHRIDALLNALGKPQNNFPSLHIAGTNGKGTVSSVLASVLAEAGYRVGLFTSPHILRFNERIRFCGEEINDEELLVLVKQVLPLVLAENGTFFEAATALAFRYFADKNVDIAVIETGLGGRLDATNILTPKNVLATAITSIDFDHMEYLGDTLQEIAAEKAGIMKEGVPCILSEVRPELRSTFEYHADRTQSSLSFLDEHYAVEIRAFRPDFSMQLSLLSPHRRLGEVESPLCGTHQARNILTAFAVLDEVKHTFPTAPEHFRRGLLSIAHNSGLRGRIELLHPGPPIVMDVAHNPSGLAMLIQTLKHCGYAHAHWNVIFTAMQDKDLDAMLTVLAPVVKRLYVPTLEFSRARLAQEVAAIATQCGLTAEAFSTVAEACESAFALEQPTLIAGSFHLAEEVLRWWEGR